MTTPGDGHAPVPVSRVSGNLVIICLTVVGVVMLSALLVLVILGRPTGVLLQVIATAAPVAIGYVGTLLKASDVARDVAQVRITTNGNTDRLLGLLEKQTEMLGQSAPVVPLDPPPAPPVLPTGG